MLAERKTASIPCVVAVLPTLGRVFQAQGCPKTQSSHTPTSSNVSAANRMIFLIFIFRIFVSRQ